MRKTYFCKHIYTKNLYPDKLTKARINIGSKKQKFRFIICFCLMSEFKFFLLNHPIQCKVVLFVITDDSIEKIRYIFIHSIV